LGGSSMVGETRHAWSMDFCKKQQVYSYVRMHTDSACMQPAPAGLLHKAQKHFLPQQMPNALKLRGLEPSKAAPGFAASQPCVVLSEPN
jgi:hypothetical protein